MPVNSMTTAAMAAAEERARQRRIERERRNYMYYISNGIVFYDLRNIKSIYEYRRIANFIHSRDLQKELSRKKWQIKKTTRTREKIKILEMAIKKNKNMQRKGYLWNQHFNYILQPETTSFNQVKAYNAYDWYSNLYY